MGGEITFGEDVLTNSTAGLYWYNGNHYGIYRTAGPWTGNFQQLRIQFDTGIQLAAGPDVNTGYDKSYVEIVTGKGLMVSSGNVGIGTTNPNAKLAVNGDIRAKEIKVEAGPWPDYVFKPNYKLPSLNIVKAYVDKNQHLPDMPSEAEVTKEGVNLGEMNRLLLKKVEELTLYVIEQQEQQKTLKQLVTRQQQQINNLKKHK